MKFLADMDISPRSVEFLQDLGHQAVHLQQQGLHELKDSEILEKARKEGCIILTHDLDFGALLAASGMDLPSVLIFRLRNMRPENVNRHLLKVVSQFHRALKDGAIVTVTEGQVRIRNLPLGTGEQAQS
jgi:predicted nuclease of predicted toxin-antitoxin system